MQLELPPVRPAGWAEVFRAMSGANVANAAVSIIFATSGPVAIILAAGSKGGMSEAQLASWIFGAFFLNGLISIAFSLVFRIPLVFLFTIPGTVLVGTALTHLSLPEVVGAYIATGLLMLALGCSGLVRRAMSAVPVPIVMAMVAGVFLQFGLDWVRAMQQGPWIAAPMTAAFLLLSIKPSFARIAPPLLVSLAVGIAASLASGQFAPALDAATLIAAPRWVMPSLSWPAIAELMLPLAVTVLVVQNGQGITLLAAAGHKPPINSIAAVCGVGSMVTAFVGTVSTCLTGPVNAILASGAPREQQYAGGVLMGVFSIAFGLFAPLFTRILLAAPPAFIATLAGLAMLKVLQGAFASAFAGRFGFGALVTFLVTVAGTPIFNIGAPFWGLVFGTLASLLLERADFADSAIKK